MAPLACVALLTFIDASQAEPIDLSPGGLAEPVSTITFDELEIADGAEVSAQFADRGVTLLPNMFYRTGDHPDWQNVEGPNLRSGDPEVNPFSVKFGSALTSAALIAIAQPPVPTTITAKLNGTEVESFETTVSIDNPDNYFGFEDITFDEIEIEYDGDTRLRIDNIQLGAQAAVGPFTITEVARAADGMVDLTWDSQPGFFYDIEASLNLTEGSWEPFMLAIAAEADPAIATSASIQGSIEASMQYLRVIQVSRPPFLGTSFEDGMGDWMVSGNGTLWEFGSPTTGPGAAHTGAGAAATGLTADYADGTVTQLRTPVIDPAGATGTFKLDFWYYLDASEGEGGQVSILEADGSLIQNLEPLYLGGADGSNTTEWTEVNLKLPKLDPVRPFIIQFNFLSVDDGDPDNGTGWLIDDVRIGK